MSKPVQLLKGEVINLIMLVRNRASEAYDNAARSHSERHEAEAVK